MLRGSWRQHVEMAPQQTQGCGGAADLATAHLSCTTPRIGVLVYSSHSLFTQAPTHLYSFPGFGQVCYKKEIWSEGRGRRSRGLLGSEGFWLASQGACLPELQGCPGGCWVSALGLVVGSRFWAPRWWASDFNVFGATSKKLGSGPLAAPLEHKVAKFGVFSYYESQKSKGPQSGVIDQHRGAAQALFNSLGCIVVSSDGVSNCWV